MWKRIFWFDWFGTTEDGEERSEWKQFTLVSIKQAQLLLQAPWKKSSSKTDFKNQLPQYSKEKNSKSASLQLQMFWQ